MTANTASNALAGRPAGTPPPEAPRVQDHLGTMIFLAVVAHALIILGIGFAVDPIEAPTREPLDITWVTDPDAPPPELDDEVEHIATRDQAASGEGEEVREAQAPDAEDAGIGEPEPEPEQVTADTPDERATPPEVADPEPLEAPDAEDRPSAATLMNRGLESARAAPAEERQTFSTRASRTRYLDSLAARSAPEAAYLQAWINKVERLGNVNYPDEARRRGLSGTLVLSVRLNPEGELINIEVARSSGEPVLDQAAIRIVELAAPYAPFTEAMREEYDELVITRTWAFRRDQIEQIR